MTSRFSIMWFRSLRCVEVYASRRVYSPIGRLIYRLLLVVVQVVVPLCPPITANGCRVHSFFPGFYGPVPSVVNVYFVDKRLTYKSGSSFSAVLHNVNVRVVVRSRSGPYFVWRFSNVVGSLLPVVGHVVVSRAYPLREAIYRGAGVLQFSFWIPHFFRALNHV